MRKPAWIEHENTSGSVTIGRCSECEELLQQQYCADAGKAKLQMDELFKEHLRRRHSGEDIS